MASDQDTGGLSVRLDRGSTLEGTLSFPGEGRIAGRYTGKLSSQGGVRIEDGAVVHAEIEVATVVILGEVVGNIRASGSVELKATAKVQGDIDTPALVVERGATLEGRCHVSSTASQGKKP